MKNNVVFRPTVVIGLGGTGYGAVLKLKKHFADAYNGNVPPIIRFLTFDTTENVEHSERTHGGELVTLQPGTEQFVLQVGNPAGLLGGVNEQVDEWWPRNIPISAIVAGAGQVRARGRLALFARIDQVFSNIERAIHDVNLIKTGKQAYDEHFQVSTRGGVEVYIVSSLAGGTGSGMFLDVSFIARRFLDATSNLTGVLVLPRIFTGRAGVHLVKPNAFGALKELEQFSKLGLKEQLTIRYGSNSLDAKQPPFDLLYLIDSINEAGKGVRETSELTSIIAQGMYIQIGSQIGADSANTVDNIKTHLSTAGRVRNRSISYGSFGVGTLSLPVRQFEAMEIDAARKLLSDGLLSGTFPDGELEVEMKRFIADHSLHEDETDDLIDTLGQREGGGPMRFPMLLGGIKFDGTAQVSIKQLHVTHRSRMEQQVAQITDANYKTLLESLLRAIDEWWERAINRPNGVTYATRFAEKLVAKLEWYQQVMEREASDQQNRLTTLNFRPVEEQIKEAAGAWLGVEKRVQAACQNYKGLVDRECELYVQRARRDKAAELYGALRQRADEYRNRCNTIRVKLEAARKNIEQQYLDATATRGGGSPFEHVLKFDSGSYQPAISPEEFIVWRTQSRGTLAAWVTMHEDDIVRDIVAFVKERYRPLTGLSIDEVLRRMPPEQVAQELSQIAHLSFPLWNYNDAKIPLNNRGVIEERFHYGVADAEDTVLKDPKISARVPHGANALSFVSTQNQQRIMLFRVKVGVPLFALNDIEDLEKAYNDPDKVVSNHIHKDWEKFPSVIPRIGEGDAMRWFALAQAPAPVGLISNRAGWYYVRSQQGKRTDNGELRLGQGRINAYAAFEKNRELVDEVKESIEAVTRLEGEARISASLRAYAEQVTGQVSSGNVDAAIKEQVEQELEEIEKYLKEMSIIR